MTIDIKNATKALYGTESIGESSDSVAKEQQAKQQALVDSIELKSSEAPAPEAIIPEPPGIIIPADFQPKFSPSISNYKSYDISDLRNFFDIKKYLEDPVAFMKNYVWSPDFNSATDKLTFDYRLDPSLNINLLTKLALDLTLNNLSLKPSIEEIRAELVKNIGGTAINYTTGPKQSTSQLKLIESYFWFWCSQIFSYNTFNKSGDKLVLTVDKDSAPALVVASLALHDYYASASMKQLNGLAVFLKDPPVGAATALNFLLNLQVSGKTYLNKSNYLKLDNSSIESFSTVNYINSPFFNNNLESISEGEKKFFSTPKEIKKCKNAIEGKIETGLRLFYKEGNDDILDKKIPKGGLGCQTSVLSWDEAVSQIFDIKNVGADNLRVNLSLPYYNELNVKNKSAIPKQTNIEQSIKESESLENTIKLLKRETYLNFQGKTLEDVLIDKNLLGELDESAAAYFNAFIKYGNPILDESKLPKNFAPFLGQYSIGNIVEKQRLLGENFSSFKNQNYFVIDKVGEENNFILYDSQVKYGTKYKYKLEELISQLRFQYEYKITLKDTTKENNKIEFTAKTIEVLNEQKLKRIEKSEVKTDFSFIDLPPTELFLKIFPVAGVNNKLIFTFQNLADSGIIIRDVPKKYWTEGWEQAKEYYEKQQGFSSSNKEKMYFFKQVLNKIKIYASKIPPKDLSSLKEFKEIDVLTGGYGTIVDLEPNTKYYFSCKSESYTGLESYFSQIYEVEIVDDAGTVFPIIKIYDDFDETGRKTKLDFGKRFRLEPALLQQAPNPDKDGIGYLDPTVFSPSTEARPQFKVRLTSKKTGKKIDFNIIYRKDFQKSSENAGSLNLKETTKEKVLISYKTEKK
jgi:hypothetical protein